MNRGIIDQAMDYLADQIVTQMVSLATNVNVAAAATTPNYTIPTKSGYKIGAVTPIVVGNYWGHYSAIMSAQNNQPAYVYFRNNHTAAHTNSFSVYVTYIKE